MFFCFFSPDIWSFFVFCLLNIWVLRNPKFPAEKQNKTKSTPFVNGSTWTHRTRVQKFRMYKKNGAWAWAWRFFFFWDFSQWVDLHIPPINGIFKKIRMNTNSIIGLTLSPGVSRKIVCKLRVCNAMVDGYGWKGSSRRSVCPCRGTLVPSWGLIYCFSRHLRTVLQSGRRPKQSEHFQLRGGGETRRDETV